MWRHVLYVVVVSALWCQISESAGLAPETRPVEERRVLVSAGLGRHVWSYIPGRSRVVRGPRATLFGLGQCFGVVGANGESCSAGSVAGWKVFRWTFLAWFILSRPLSESTVELDS